MNYRLSLILIAAISTVPGCNTAKDLRKSTTTRIAGGYLIDLPQGALHVERIGTDSALGDIILPDSGLVVSYDIGSELAGPESLKKMSKAKGMMDLYFSISELEGNRRMRVLPMYEVSEKRWAGGSFSTNVRADQDVDTVIELLRSLRPIKKWCTGGTGPEWLKRIVESDFENRLYVFLPRVPDYFDKGFKSFYEKNGLRTKPQEPGIQQQTHYVATEDGYFVLYTAYVLEKGTRINIQYDSVYAKWTMSPEYAGQGSHSFEKGKAPDLREF
jgi:hypothetical protein